MNLDEAERFNKRSQQFWWRRQKLPARVHATLLGRALCGAASLVFSFAIVSSLSFGHSRLIWYSAVAVSYGLAWRGFRHYRVRYLFERAGPQTFAELRKLTAPIHGTGQEGGTIQERKKDATLLHH